MGAPENIADIGSNASHIQPWSFSSNGIPGVGAGPGLHWAASSGEQAISG